MPKQAFKIWGVPGAGKTTELRNRVLDLIEWRQYRPHDFTICVYGVRPAREWRDAMGWDVEFEDKIGSLHGTIKTIHGVCKEIADIHNVITEQQKAEFCKSVDIKFKPNATHSYEVTDIFGLPVLQTKKYLGNLFFNANSYLINNMLPGDRIREYQRYNDIEMQVTSAIDWMPAMQKRYQEWKERRDLADFDDMLLHAYNLGSSPPGKVLVVDETQDLTKIMFHIINDNWVPDMEMVFFAGDPRQTIFGFRGASSEFFDRLPGKMVYLPKTHRLPNKIWAFAKAIVQDTGQEVPELTPNDKDGLLRKIAESEYHEMIKNRTFVSDTFHLVRTNHQAQKIAYALIEAGIPFTGIMGWEDELKALYSLFRKVRSPNLTEMKFNKSEIFALLNAYPEEVFSGKIQAIKDALNELSEPYIFRQIKFIPRNDIFGEPELWKIIHSTDPLSIAKPWYCNPGGRRNKIMNALNCNADLFREGYDIVLATIHSVKGSERSTVFLHDQCRKDTAFDARFNRSSTHAKSEACVYYVGATRSSRNLYIVIDNCKYHYPFPPTEGV